MIDCLELIAYVALDFWCLHSKIKSVIFFPYSLKGEGEEQFKDILSK